MALNGQGGTDTITIQNSGATSATLATGGTENDMIEIQNAGANSRVQADGDDGNDIITLGSPTNVISGILGQLLVNGGTNLAAPTHPPLVIKGDSERGVARRRHAEH